jgi:hypothetical protein
MEPHVGWVWVPAHYVWTPRGYVNEKELRRLQVLEVVYNMLIEEDSLLEKLNDMYEFEVGEKINITKEELMEVVEDLKTL